MAGECVAAVRTRCELLAGRARRVVTNSVPVPHASSFTCSDTEAVRSESVSPLSASSAGAPPASATQATRPAGSGDVSIAVCAT